MKAVLQVCALLALIGLAKPMTVRAESLDAGEFGYADRTLPETAQFEYYRGEWVAEMKLKKADGTFEKLSFVANIKGRYLPDHQTFQTEFSSTTGFFSTDIRAYKRSTGEWEALFLNAEAQRWHHFTSGIVDGKMTTLVIGGYSGNEPFDVKVVDTRISVDHYVKHVYQSADKMKSWALTYEIDVRRK
jgi:hypothetical protein